MPLAASAPGTPRRLLSPQAHLFLPPGGPSAVSLPAPLFPPSFAPLAPVTLQIPQSFFEKLSLQTPLTRLGQHMHTLSGWQSCDDLVMFISLPGLWVS